MRGILLGILVAFAVPVTGCSKESAPTVAANAVVGKVAAVSGKVEASRAGASRVLAVGSEIFGDDEVIVGADGSVGIDLAHNNARWTLESGRRGKVRESAAWTMAKVDTPSKPVEHATSAAGREGERSAGTSATTESAAAPAPEPAAAVAPGATATPPPPTQAPPKSDAKPEPKAERRARDTEALGGLGLQGTGEGGGGAGVGVGLGGKGGSIGGATGASRGGSVKSPTTPKPMEEAKKEETDRMTNDAPPPPPPGGPTGAGGPPMVDPEDKARQDAIKKTIYAQHATLKTCGATGIRLNITVVRGVAKPLLVSGKATPEQLKCIETKLQQLKLQHASSLTVVLDF